MASPTTAPRPWPTCIGPVGLAETYSTITVRPAPTWLRPYSLPFPRTSPRPSSQTRGAIQRFKKPGPAISTLVTTLASSTRLSSRIWAICRGGLPAALLSSIAALDDQSPWAGFLGASTAGSWASGGRSPFSTQRASVAAMTRWAVCFTNSSSSCILGRPGGPSI